MRRLLCFMGAACLSLFAPAQPTEITIDGQFDDWPAGLPGYTDAVETLTGVNLLDFAVTNDEDWLYLKLHANIEFDLTDNLVSHTTYLYIDTDNNPATGFAAATGIGAELGINFRTRTVFYNVTPSSTLGMNDILLRCLPTVTSDTFEMAIPRDIVPDGINPLFPSSTIRIVFRNTGNADYLPNNGTIFSYTFNDSAVPPIPVITLERNNALHLRIVAYNSLGQLGTASAQDNFQRILTAINPDIIAFSECSGNTAVFVKALLDTWLPNGGSGWYTIKDDYDLITCSRWPILGNWSSLDRQHAVHLDLPATYATDLLLINAHLQCCTADATRQNQCDEAIQFIADARTAGGTLTLPANTPIVYCGDLNLVGYAQQLNTLVTGNIINNGTYGPDSPPDWDGTSFTNLISRNNALRMAYTWRDDTNSYPPGHLDYFIYSDAAMGVSKSFVLETEEMDPATLALYGLNTNDTMGASDHFPITADFIIPLAVADTDGDGVPDDTDNCPVAANPSQEDFNADGIGDACGDADMDGVIDINDNCPLVSNPLQSDINSDGTGDACGDIDSDGILDYTDNCPFTSNPSQVDLDADGIGDACDDSDGDGIYDSTDNCIDVPNPDQIDSNSNGIGDACETTDTDGDGIIDISDNCPFNPNPGQSDFNGNGIGDVCEDSDSDGLTDAFELNLSQTNPQNPDTDGNGCDDGAQLNGNCGGCVGDLNLDGLINTTDLLLFLSVYGTTCP